MMYQDFIAGKSFAAQSVGFSPDAIERYPLFDYQAAIVTWACHRGRSAIFADTGLGKTIMQLSWADQVARHTGGSVLVLAPLAVSEQTIAEGKRFGITVSRYTDKPDPGIYITNYEQLHNVDCDAFAGVVLDESSILKGMQGKLRAQITSRFSSTPYRLSCTATPSPNDFMELGTQAEFLGIMSQVEMLSMFFVHDGSDTSKWRLRGHGRKKFFEWLATWAVFISRPSDIGFENAGHDLPELIMREHIVESGERDGLFAPVAQGLLERNRARKNSVDRRVEVAADIANQAQGQILVWCHLNEESEKLTAAIDGAVEVKGSDDASHKASAMLGFSDGEVRALISKPKIAGFGMNWQQCNEMVFVGLSDSWEQFYQAVRRCWRFGQTRPVTVHVIFADTEGAVLENIRRKEAQQREMKAEMISVMRDQTLAQLGMARQEKTEYQTTTTMELPAWVA